MFSRGLAGFVGQGMSGAKPLSTVRTLAAPVWTVAAGSGSWTATEDCTAYVFVTGGGAVGGSTGSQGGGGAGATYRRYKMLKGQTVSYVVGAATTNSGNTVSAGADATATFPDGIVITGQGGQSTLGGVGSGGDLNRSGGNGVNNNSAGLAGQFGGAGGANTGGTGSGGGAAGFSDIVAWPAGAGGTSNAGAGGFPGGGTGGGVVNGTIGQVVILTTVVNR